MTHKCIFTWTYTSLDSFCLQTILCSTNNCVYMCVWELGGRNKGGVLQSVSVVKTVCQSQARTRESEGITPLCINVYEPLQMGGSYRKAAGTSGSVRRMDRWQRVTGGGQIIAWEHEISWDWIGIVKWECLERKWLQSFVKCWKLDDVLAPLVALDLPTFPEERQCKTA